MKIGIISDIHSNYDALMAIINEFKKEKVDKYICLGDMIGFGKYPDKCVQFMIDNKDKILSIVKGNHEKYLLSGTPKKAHNAKNGRVLDENELKNHEINHSKLNDDQMDFIKSLNDIEIVEVNGFKIFVSHYPKYEQFYKYTSLNECKDIFDNIDANIFLFGHTHIERYYIDNDKHYINPGPVGCPVIINSASCGILEITDHIEYKHKYVSYDINKTMNDLLKENIPYTNQFLNIFYGKDNRFLNINYKDKTIKGFLELPKTFKEKYPLVIMVHGFNGSYLHGLVPIGNRLAKNGIMSYSFDFINGSDNSISGGNIFNISLEDELNQLIEVCKVLTSLENVDKDNIYILGRSQGGFLASQLVSKHIFDFKGLIMFYPAFNIVDIAHEKFNSCDDIKDDSIFGCLVNSNYYKDAYYINVDNILNNIDIKTLLFHGKLDNIVDIKYSNYANSKIKDCKYYVFDNETHGFTILNQLKDVKIIEKFIKKSSN